MLGQFTKEFGRRRIDSITSEETFSFLAFLTGARKQSTRYSRCAHLRAFFNHILDRYKLGFANPCDTLIIKRVFRPARIGIRTVIDRETIDEIIYGSQKVRDRLILELQARAGMRIGEVLKLTPNDIDGVKVTINGATLLFISGVVAFDSQGRVVGKGDIKAQTRQVLENLKDILEAEGATFRDIVKITNFYMDFEDYPKIAEVRSEYFGDWPPASTGIEVKRLIDKDLLIEIEAVAVI